MRKQQTIAVKPKLTPQRCQCFALKVKGYYYGLMMTALLRAPHPSGRISTSNLVCVLNYRETVPPRLEVFERRDWMRLYFGQWQGKRLMMWCATNRRFEAERLVHVGDVVRRPADPVESPKVGWWDGLIAVLEEVSTLPTITAPD